MNLELTSAPVAIVTSVYDAYDPLPEICPQTMPVDWVVVTDDPDLEAPGWRVVHAPSDDPPRRAAKHPKLHPFDYTPAPVTIWTDAAFHVDNPEFAADMFAVAAAHPWAMFAHPSWDCIYVEAVALATLGRHVGDLVDQAKHYDEVGHPPGWGLWASGVIVRRHTARNVALGDVWDAEMRKWDDHHDQLTWAHIAWVYGVDIYPLPGSYVENRWMRHCPSRRHWSCD